MEKGVPLCPPLLTSPLYIGIYGGHTMPKIAPPVCPLCAPHLHLQNILFDSIKDTV